MVDAFISMYTGEPGGGKSYMCVEDIIFQLLPFRPDLKVLTNIPMYVDADLGAEPGTEKIRVEDFPQGWLPPGRTLDEMTEYLRDTVLVVDEFQGVLTKETEQDWKEICALVRKKNSKFYFLSQSKENFPKWMQELSGYWVESCIGSDLRDTTLGFRIGDLQNIWAKLTGRYVPFFLRQEYKWQQRRWRKIGDGYRVFADKRVFNAYDTKNGADIDENGNAAVRLEWKLLTLWQVLWLAGVRNWHVIPSLVLRNGMILVPLVLGVGCIFYLPKLMGKGVPSMTKHSVPETPEGEPRAVKRDTPSRPEPLPVPSVAPAPSRVQARRVVTWSLLLCCLLLGCRGAGRVEFPIREHVSRTGVTAEPRVALYGPGHSLDQALESAGIKSATEKTVDGPLVGREVLDAARSAGYSLQGDTLVPSRKRPVPVPSEITATDTVMVGGFPVKVADDSEVDRWRELSGVVHESYVTELMVVSVSSSYSRQLSAIASGQGGVTVSVPAAVRPFGGAASVTLAAGGSTVKGREVAHPVLACSPGASASVHVGNRVPVRMTNSTVSNQTTTTIGGTLTYVVTGTNVALTPSRVSSSQVRLVGVVTLSDQAGTNDGVPVTSERNLTLDHLLRLDEWELLGRLDGSSDKWSAGWIALGGLRQMSDETFLVVGKVRQVSSDDRLHKSADGSAVVVKDVTKGASDENADRSTSGLHDSPGQSASAGGGNGSGRNAAGKGDSIGSGRVIPPWAAGDGVRLRGEPGRSVSGSDAVSVAKP